PPALVPGAWPPERDELSVGLLPEGFDHRREDALSRRESLGRGVAQARKGFRSHRAGDPSETPPAGAGASSSHAYPRSSSSSASSLPPERTTFPSTRTWTKSGTMYVRSRW